MTISFNRKTTWLLLAAFFILPATSAHAASDGLVELDIDTLEYIAVHPGADFSTFSKIHIEPVTLAFRRNWRPVKTGTNLTLGPTQLARIQEELEAQFMQEFSAGLESNARLEIVAEPALRVLRITPRITEVTGVNLEGNAAAAETRGARKLGHARLTLEIHDVRTGIKIGELRDERNLVQEGRMGVSSVQSRKQFGELFRSWGKFIGNGVMNIDPDKH